MCIFSINTHEKFTMKQWFLSMYDPERKKKKTKPNPPPPKHNTLNGFKITSVYFSDRSANIICSKDNIMGRFLLFYNDLDSAY